MKSDFAGPVNIGSEEMVTINQLAEMVMAVAGKRLTINHIPGPLGVRGRNSDNRLIRSMLGWSPSALLRAGLEEHMPGSMVRFKMLSRRPLQWTFLLRAPGYRNPVRLPEQLQGAVDDHR